MRQAFAAAISSSAVALHSRHVSLRASRAISSPTLFQTLKQSTTVFAGLYTFVLTPFSMCSCMPKE